MRYDVIPDLHADPVRLEDTLTLLGEDAQPAFLGDFIDGKANAADDETVLVRTRALIDAGAPAVMGNHELNAILFHTFDAGGPLRAHDDKNLRQHASFIDRFGIATPAARHWVEWFLRLPLWQDLGELRLVHACWNQAAIDLIRARRPDGRLQPEDLPEISSETTAFGRAVKLLVTGPEVPLPSGYAFTDKAGHLRHDVRIAWWRSGARTWKEAALSVPDPSALPEQPLPDMPDIAFYPDGEVPVFVGHYKMLGRPMIEGASAVCLDYPDTTCAYRWRGERRLTPENLLAL